MLGMFREYKEDGPHLLTGTDAKLRASFILSGVGTTVANTLRRAILMYTKTVGFRADLTNSSNPGIRKSKNTSPIINEMLAHRLTLVPIGIRDITGFDPSRFEFALKVANNGSERMDVTADMIQIRQKGDDGIFRPVVGVDMFPRDPITGSTCLLTILRPQWNPEQPPDEIDLVATAVFGTGEEFMGFSPVSQAAFHNTLDEDPVRQDSFFKEWLQGFKKIEDLTTVEPATLALYRKEWNTMAVQRCFQVDKYGEPNSFTFSIETVGVRPVRDIVTEAIQAVITLVNRYTDPLSLEGVTFATMDSRMTGTQAIFTDQEHTLGCLLEAMIHETLLDDTYVAYKVPHPLQKRMILLIGKPEQEAVQLIVSAAKKAASLFGTLKEDWLKSI
jgi:DNA-directed RNA polymerase subunit L